jgi:hypothetical protein
MPALLAIPWLIPLISGIGAAASLGTTAYEMANKPSTPSTSSTTTDAAAQKSALAAQQKAAMLAQGGNTQSQTGGSLTPAAFSMTSAKNAGVPSDLNSIMQSLGGSGGGSAPANLSGGTTTPGAENTPQPGNLQNLSDLLKG